MRNGRRNEKIRELRERGLSLRAIGRKVGLSAQQINRILAATEPQTPAEEFVHPLSVLLDDDDESESVPLLSMSLSQQARGYLSKLRDADPAMRDLILWRLAHVMPPDEYAALCERIVSH